MKFLSILIIILVISVHHSAMASQRLTFKKPNDFKALEVASYAAKELKINDLVVATVDLNDDFIDEYIVRDSNCAVKEFCTSIIVAYMNRKPISLGRFDAHQIIISNKKDYGIRRLIVYNQKNNDFANSTVIWHPHQYQYDFSK